MKKRIIYIGVVVLACSVLSYFLIPAAIELYTLLQRYNARTADKNDYTKHTTPLSPTVAEDICSKFDLDPNDERCLPGAVVYGPDFFKDIKTYFGALSDQAVVLQTVEEKLGTYLIGCGNPDNEGVYRCKYDLRGDGIYRISIYFTKEGYMYRIMTNEGGS
jgi:hypothetical protein